MRTGQRSEWWQSLWTRIGFVEIQRSVCGRGQKCGYVQGSLAEHFGSSGLLELDGLE